MKIERLLPKWVLRSLMLIGVVLSCLLVYKTFTFTMTGRYARYLTGGSFSGTHPDMSPDGNTIVFATPHTGRGDIYSISADGTSRKQLTSCWNYEGEPHYAPKGDWIAYIREDEEGITHVWVMRADGSGQRQLTHGTNHEHSPCFSPDGTQIVFTRSYPNTDTALFEVSVSDNTVHPLTQSGQTEGQASFDRAGNRLVFASGPPAGEWLLKTTGEKTFVGAGGLSSCLSPDGNHIAFINNADKPQLCVMNSDGSGVKTIYGSLESLYEPGGYMEACAFSPDSKHILFLEAREQDRGTGLISLIGVDGKGLQRIGSSF